MDEILSWIEYIDDDGTVIQVMLPSSMMAEAFKLQVNDSKDKIDYLSEIITGLKAQSEG